MANTLIAHPILNSPFAEPTRHVRFGDDGITNEVVVARRANSYFVPIERSKVNGKVGQVYDPTTGQVRSNSVGDIACWFLDTAYDEQTFVVRHAYFTGADQPYERLQKALRAEIDEAAWVSLYATTSRPFDPPKTGKIVVKVINHYGDEVLKVFPIR